MKARTWNPAPLIAAAMALPGHVFAQIPQAPEPPLPEPDWKEVESISLFPRLGDVPAAGSAGGSAQPVPAAPAPPVSIPGIPELDLPPSRPENPVPLPGIGRVLSAPGFGVDPFARLPALPDIDELPAEIREMEEQGQGRVIWHVNPRKARKIAAKEGKVLVLAFLGLGWNGQSRALEEDVFGTEAFKAFASQEAVLAYLDFPAQYEKTHPVFHAFKKRCGVKGVPSLALFGPDGEQFATLGGYNKKHGPRAYMHDLINRVQSDTGRREQVAGRLAQLEADGFRSWRNAKERTALLRLRGVAGERAYFENPEGRKSATPLARLHIVDREIALREAKARGKYIP